jgi:RNA polymerase sigma-70 factor (ECF subfamily)
MNAPAPSRLSPLHAMPRGDGASEPAATMLDPTVSAAVGGDERAMQALVHRLLPRVRNAVRYLVRGDEIDDLVQDVMVTMIERLDSFEGRGRFEAWVDGISLRVTLSRMRKVRSLDRRSSPLSDAAPALDAPNRAGQAYATSRQLVGALDRLSDSQRSAVVMHHVFGLTVPEIAGELEVPLETVRTRLRDGMGQLRAHLRVQSER